MLHLAISTIPTVGDWHITFRLGLAAILGGAIGVERELRDREAGIRTHLLVSLGSALFTLVSAYGFHEFLASGDSVVRADPTRIAAYKWMGRIKPEENRLIVELKDGQPVGPFLALLDDVQFFELTDETDRRVLQLELKHIDEELVSKLSDLDYVIGVRWRR